ncbi:MAG: TonB-dependent receptor [Sphingomonadaceae bacterium]|nr:TonB-dependent receptor [Sphingomonadaceae bacterium]
MNNTRFRALLLSGSLIASTAMVAAPALAQDAPPPAADAGVEAPEQIGNAEIVVTAQFREQRLQDTPLSITAVDAALLESRSQTNIAEIANQAPNVTLRQQGASFGGSLGASIRGIGQFDFNPAVEPGVGIYVDDVYYPTLTGSTFELLDLQRIEILRGPQGTLTGRNSVGGAIRLISQRPDGSGEGFVEATYGSRDHIAIRGGADFTIAENLFARISGIGRQQDGYVDRIDYGCAFPGQGIPAGEASQENDCVVSEHGGTGYTAVRGQLRYEPSPDFDILFSADYTDDSRTAGAEILTAANVNNPNGNPAPGVPFDSRFICGPFCNYSGYQNPAGVWLGPVAPGFPLVATSGPDRTEFEGWGVSLNMDIGLSDMLSLQSISAYREYATSFNSDDDNSPATLAFGQNALDHWFLSQELRLNGEIGDTIDFTLGGYYSDQRTTYFTFQDIRYAPIPLQFIGDDPVNADSLAAFATVIWNPIDPLTITGGLRYTEESKDYTFVRLSPFGGPNAFLGALNGVVGEFEGDRIDYRISVDYRISPEVLVYVSTSTGFKGGGINPRPFNPAQVQPFDPETLTAYELGFKTDLFDRRLRFNASAFFNKYNGIQLTLLSCPQFGGPGPCALPQNAGDAEIFGLEFEALFEPVDGLTFDGSLSYINFEYQCVNITVVRALLPGETDACVTDSSIVTAINPSPPHTPEWKWSAGVQYAIDTGFGTITPRFDITHQSGTFVNVLAGAATLPSYTVANARLTWESEDEAWQASLEVTNLFDEYYFLTNFDLSQVVTGSPNTLIKAQPGRPREWALTVTRRF